jgi:hypothetical protein
MKKAVIILFINFFVCFVYGQNTGVKPEGSFTVESYYKIKWGHTDEFIALYKKNHYPLLKKAYEHGDILKITAEKPRLHASEETRWDFRVTVVFKNARTAYDEELLDPYKAQVFKNLKNLEKEEQARFELVLAHWDVTPARIDLDAAGL